MDHVDNNSKFIET